MWKKNLLGCEEAAAGRAGILTAAEEGKQNNRMQVTKQRKEMSKKIEKLKTINHLRFLQVEAEDWEEEGHGAGMLSLRSQVKLIPESLSNIASDGKLGNRQPDSINQKDSKLTKAFDNDEYINE